MAGLRARVARTAGETVLAATAVEPLEVGLSVRQRDSDAAEDAPAIGVCRKMILAASDSRVLAWRRRWPSRPAVYLGDLDAAAIESVDLSAAESGGTIRLGLTSGFELRFSTRSTHEAADFVRAVDAFIGPADRQGRGNRASNGGNGGNGSHRSA